MLCFNKLSIEIPKIMCYTINEPNERKVRSNEKLSSCFNTKLKIKSELINLKCRNEKESSVFINIYFKIDWMVEKGTVNK